MPNSHKNLLKLLILIFILSNASSQMDYCGKFCDACVEDSISCTRPGFKEMPQHISKTIKRFILISQQFTNSFLSPENFSHFSPPYVNIEYLCIRKSNIKFIKSMTFSDLSMLRSLDLTYNSNLFIDSRSFSGLKLRLLKLDNNDNLKFSINAFVDLVVDSLHMSSSSIDQLPYDLLKPILPFLKKLFLNHNKLVVLDPRFQNSFKNLQTLYLHENEFDCSCQMKWLTAVYTFRTTNEKHSKVTFSDDSEPRPTCKQPDYMKGKQIHEIPLSLFNCDPPNLTQLKIDFQSATETELSCSAVQNVDQAPMSIGWFTDMINGIGRKLSSILNPISNSDSMKKVHIDTVLIQKNNSIDSFQCIAINLNGNATAIVRISWPPSDKLIKRDKNFYQSTIDSWQKSDEDNYLFQKRFTLLEMFGAVFGTFSITLILFFMIYKFVFINRNIDRKSMLPPNGYTTYEAAVYSDSQTYDIPGNSYPQSVLLPMPHLSSTPDHFIDFKTQRKFYQTT